MTIQTIEKSTTDQNLAGNSLLAITVLDLYEDDGPKEVRFSGFLINSNHAMFVEQSHGQAKGALMLVEVKPTNDPLVYLTSSYTTELGIVEGDHSETIKSTAKMLLNMTAYEFIIKIICKLVNYVNFKDLIVSIPVKNDFIATQDYAEVAQ